MKVYIAHLIDEYDGQVDTDIEVFSTIEKAREQKQKWIEADGQFVEDVKSLIVEGYIDSDLVDEDDYFWAYDSVNFNSKTINIFEIEVK